jgi:hypothetical protein
MSEAARQRLHVVNFKGRQAQSTLPFSLAAGVMVVFQGGAYACVTDGDTSGPVWFVEPGEDGYLPADAKVGSEITVTDVDEDGNILTRTADSSTVVTGSGTTVNQGDPDGARRGIQVGSHNKQYNTF